MVRKAEKSDLKILSNLASQLWVDSSANDLLCEFSDIISNESVQLFLNFENGMPVGFAQCQLRYDYVEGTQTSPVGYLEGIFIKQSYRGRGYAKELLLQCENWAKSKGCREFASDCEIDNTESLHFHKAMNFTEANRIICFTKKL